MRVSAIAMFVSISLLAGTTALAQTVDQQWAYCENASGSNSFDQQIAGCSKLIEIGQDSPTNLAVAYYNRGTAYAAKQDLTRAIADYDQAIRLNPQYALAYNNRGLAFIKLGRKAEGEADIAKAKSIDPRFGH